MYFIFFICIHNIYLFSYCYYFMNAYLLCNTAFIIIFHLFLNVPISSCIYFCVTNFVGSAKINLMHDWLVWCDCIITFFHC